MRMYGRTMTVVTAFLLVASTCYAKRVSIDTEKASVGATVKGIEKKLKTHPEDEALLYRLSQVHATAYASKAKTIEVQMGTTRPWYGYRYIGIPYKVIDAGDKSAQARAMVHLQKTTELHKRVVKLNPKHHHARLGLAWCMEQHGKTEEAKALYRAVIKDTLPGDRKLKMAEGGTITLSTEASNRLVIILQAEIDALNKQSEETEKNIPRIKI